MTLHIRLAAASLMLAALGACSREPAAPEKSAAAPAAVVASSDVHPFRVGALEVAALRDGALELPVADADANPWPPAQTTALLTAAGVTDGTVHLSIQPLLVRDGDRLVLIDSGAGGQMGAGNKLLASLRAAGVEPAEITDVLISHAHGDHVGGLVTAAGDLTFPNAVIRMSEPEWEYARAGAAEAGAEALLAAITDRVRPFAPGAALTPSITAVPLQGHTPGHSGYEIASGDERLLYIGDAMHSPVISVQRPDLTNAWDDDSEAAIRTRRGLLERGGREGLRIYAGHFPFPGVGRFEQRGDGFVWVPEGPAQP